MIVTRNWLNDWINLGEISTDDICKTLNKIGLEVSSVKRYHMVEKCVIGVVESKTNHPNAEKLSVCMVNVGQNAPLQIVCGAKNVSEGQLVPVALVGCELPDGLIIEETILRGIKSSGMICSSTELGYPKINEGIMILDSSLGGLRAGTPLISIPELRDDVIEIELTPNRGDCLSIYGIARDLGAVYDLKVKLPNVIPDDPNQMGIGRVLDLKVDGKIDSSLIYKVLYQKEIVGNVIMDLRLAMIGSEAKNLIEKYLTYATHATGVVLRAYKTDVFASVKSGNANQDQDEKVEVIVKKDENNFDSIYGKEQVSRVGIWQSEHSKPADDDSIIIIEASFINPNDLGKSGARSSEKSDWALFRALRGSEVNLEFGINYFNSFISKTSKIGILGGTQHTIRERAARQINVDFDDMFSIIGMELNKTDVISILKNLNFYTSFKHEQNLLIADVPPFRHDIENIQDVCEEIVRTIGIDNIRARSLKFVETNRINKTYDNFLKKKFYRHKAVGAGFFETVSYIFADKTKQVKYNFACVDEELELNNPITNELNTLRTTCVLNLIEAAGCNAKVGVKSISLFELGKVFDSKRNEKTVMSFISSGESEFASPANHGKPMEFNFASFAQKIGSVLGKFSILPDTPEGGFYSPYEYGKIVINEKVVGIIGRAAAERDFDLGKTYICEVDFDAISCEQKVAKAYSKLPSVSRDLTLLIPKNVSYFDIKECLKERAPKELKVFYPTDTYKDDTLLDKNNITLRLIFEPDEKTFADEDINNMMEQIIESLLVILRVTIR